MSAFQTYPFRQVFHHFIAELALIYFYLFSGVLTKALNITAFCMLKERKAREVTLLPKAEKQSLH